MPYFTFQLTCEPSQIMFQTTLLPLHTLKFIRCHICCYAFFIFKIIILWESSSSFYGEQHILYTLDHWVHISVVRYPCASMDSINSAPIRSRFDRWKMESFGNNSSRHSNYSCDRRRSASSNRSNGSTRSDMKNGENYGCAFHGYNKYSALWNRSAKCIVCMSFFNK